MYININVESLIITLVIGLVAGFVVNSLAGRRNNSLLSNLLLGLAGAFVGSLLLPAVGIRYWGFVGNLIGAIAGSVVILMIGSLLKGKSRTRF